MKKIFFQKMISKTQRTKFLIKSWYTVVRKKNRKSFFMQKLFVFLFEVVTCKCGSLCGIYLDSTSIVTGDDNEAVS